MFNTFGEFDSYEEINRAAAAQLKEGDTDAVFAIARENGIEQEDAEDFSMAAAVRRKGKSLSGCIAAIVKWSFEHAKPVPEDIKKACGISYRVSFGIPGMATAKQLLTRYYKEVHL